MREPIEPKDIREGDLIRWEDGETAHEFRRGKHGTIARHGQHYLLDRPKPVMKLPIKPTLGRVEFDDGDWFVGTVQANLDGRTFTAARHDTGYYSALWNADKVAAFTPAVAVPAEALEKLRHAERGHHIDGLANWEWEVVNAAFLAAVDNANEQATR